MDITNYLEWFLYAFAIMFVIDIDIENNDFTEPASKRTVSIITEIFQLFILTKSGLAVASGINSSMVIMDCTFTFPTKVAQSRSLHFDVQHYYANILTIRYCLCTVYAQFFNVLFYAALEHSAVRLSWQIICQVINHDDWRV